MAPNMSNSTVTGAQGESPSRSSVSIETTNEVQPSQSEDDNTSQDLGHNGPMVVAHTRELCHEQVTEPLNCVVLGRNWKVIGPIDELVTYGSGSRDMTELDYFK